jgi:carbon monoxide dehydrogenase subunit G
MYLLASTSVAIECTRARVFDYVADFANFPQWFPGVVEVQSRDALPPATVGKLYAESFRVPLRGRRSTLVRVVEVAPARRFVTEGAVAHLMPRMEIELHDAGDGCCRVQWRMLSRNTARVARWTVLPLARLALQQRADAAMRRLKQRLESARGPR